MRRLNTGNKKASLLLGFLSHQHQIALVTGRIGRGGRSSRGGEENHAARPYSPISSPTTQQTSTSSGAFLPETQTPETLLDLDERGGVQPKINTGEHDDTTTSTTFDLEAYENAFSALEINFSVKMLNKEKENEVEAKKTKLNIEEEIKTKMNTGVARENVEKTSSERTTSTSQFLHEQKKEQTTSTKQLSAATAAAPKKKDEESEDDEGGEDDYGSVNRSEVDKVEVHLLDLQDRHSVPGVSCMANRIPTVSISVLLALPYLRRR